MWSDLTEHHQKTIRVHQQPPGPRAPQRQKRRLSGNTEERNQKRRPIGRRRGVEKPFTVGGMRQKKRRAKLLRDTRADRPTVGIRDGGLKEEEEEQGRVRKAIAPAGRVASGLGTRQQPPRGGSNRRPETKTSRTIGCIAVSYGAAAAAKLWLLAAAAAAARRRAHGSNHPSSSMEQRERPLGNGSTHLGDRDRTNPQKGPGPSSLPTLHIAIRSAFSLSLSPFWATLPLSLPPHSAGLDPRVAAIITLILLITNHKTTSAYVDRPQGGKLS